MSLTEPDWQIAHIRLFSISHLTVMSRSYVLYLVSAMGSAEYIQRSSLNSYFVFGYVGLSISIAFSSLLCRVCVFLCSFHLRHSTGNVRATWRLVFATIPLVPLRFLWTLTTRSFLCVSLQISYALFCDLFAIVRESQKYERIGFSILLLCILSACSNSPIPYTAAPFEFPLWNH
jgi:hypothetical protein